MKQHWDLSAMPQLKGKIAIVTGGNSGLGYETVKAFAQKGARVIMASRDMAKGEEAKAQILKNEVEGSIEVKALDLMNLASIKNFADQMKSELPQLNLLINNAGIMTTPYFTTSDGFEAQLGTNHLGHFALSGQLLGLLLKTPQSRIVNVSSMAHKAGKIHFDNLLFENGKGYQPMKAYAQSKLANLLFTYELQRKLNNNKAETIAVAAHPGVSRTGLMRYIEKYSWFKIGYPLFKLISQTPDMGALPQIRAAVDANVQGGEYYGPDGFNEMKGHPVKVKSNAASHQAVTAQKLWEVSEKLTGVTFQF